MDIKHSHASGTARIFNCPCDAIPQLLGKDLAARGSIFRPKAATNKKAIAFYDELARKLMRFYSAGASCLLLT